MYTGIPLAWSQKKMAYCLSMDRVNAILFSQSTLRPIQHHIPKPKATRKVSNYDASGGFTGGGLNMPRDLPLCNFPDILLL